MNDKLLVKIIIPELDESYDVFIPANEVIWKICKLTTKVAFDFFEKRVNLQNGNYIFINKNTGTVYQNNQIVIDTDIRNGSELILVSVDNNSQVVTS